VRACTALLAIDDELMTGLHTIVRREAGPKGKLELTLRVCANYLYRVSRGTPYQVSELHVEAPVPLLAPNLSGFMAFDALTGQLYATDKSLLERGCGLVQHWRYDGGLMHPERVARMDRCGYVKPEFWPVLWRVEG
jgi:hypothetical protein